MPTLYITEFALEGQDASGRIVPVAKAPPLAEQAVAFSTSTQSATFNSQTTLVRLHTDGICSVAFGASPTATTSNLRMTAGQTEYFSVTPGAGFRVAAVNNV